MNYRQIIINTLTIRDGDVCRICGKEFTDFAPAELDHIEPKSNGGTDTVYNLHLVHSICNRRKGRSKWSEKVNQDPLSNANKRIAKILPTFGSPIDKLKALEIEVIKSTYKEKNKNQTHTAAALGITRRRLKYFMDKNPGFFSS